jgi:hypothetical protein
MSTTATALPVTDEDVLSAWRAMFTTRDYGVLPPRADDWHDTHLLAQLRAVLENDRKRVIELSTKGETT